jgi:hypothetical protein
MNFSNVFTILVLILTCTSSVASSEIVCSTDEGEKILADLAFLHANQFTTEKILKKLNRFLDDPSVLEAWIRITSDQEKFESKNKFRLPWTPTDPFELKPPIVHFYKIGENAFWEYQEVGSPPKWYLIKGQNILEGSLQGIEYYYAGHRWRGNLERRCRDYHRRIIFVVPNLPECDTKDLKDFLKAFDQLLFYPDNLEIVLCNTLSDILDRKEQILFGLHARSKLQSSVDKPTGHMVEYFRSRYSNRSKEIRFYIYNGNRLIISQRWQED